MENRKTTKRYLWVKELAMYVNITEDQWDKLISAKMIHIEKIHIYKEIQAKPKINKT